MLLFGSKNNTLLVVVLYLIGVNQGQKQKWKSLRIFFFCGVSNTDEFSKENKFLQ